jgi:hypothetical protein
MSSFTSCLRDDRSSNMNNTMRTVAGLALIVALMAAAVAVQAEREQAYPSAPASDDSLYLRSGNALRQLSLAFPGLAADLYWIRTIQYYGGIKHALASEPRAIAPPAALAADPSVAYPLLYPLLDLTTTLDPSFNIAYRFGAIFLSEEPPEGPGRSDLAIALLEKGLRARADKWEYMQDIGFVYYWHEQDYQMAAAWFDKAGRVPGAPWWLKSMAATTLAKGDDRQSSRQMWQAIFLSTDNDWLRHDANRRLMQLRALDEIDQLQPHLEEFARRTGAHATSWAPLVAAGVIGGVAVDPSGTPYQIGPDGRLQVSTASPLWPMPQGPEIRNQPPA